MCTARSSVLRDVRMLDRKIVDLNGRVEAEVEASGTTLTEIFGIGTILAATILGTVGDVGRFPTKSHYFASYAGTAPVEASSGQVVRHRLSRWAATVSSTTPCTWSPQVKPGRTLRGATTARS
jgi:transposase